MKKGIAISILIITFIMIYFLQLNFFSWFTIARVMPNLFVIFILFIGLYSGARMGMTFGIIFGIMIDFLGNSMIRRIGNCSRSDWLYAEGILKKTFQKIAKSQ